jgi:Na+/melibiose symporter-like transporter
MPCLLDIAKHENVVFSRKANYFVLTAQGCALAFIPLWVWVAHKLDKRRAFILGMASWVFVLAGIALLRPEQTGLAYLLAALSGSIIAAAYLLPWAMIPDIIETDELITGERREGSFYAWGYPISRESHRLMRAELAERLKETQ